MKKITSLIILSLSIFTLTANSFNKSLTSADLDLLNQGQTIIKNLSTLKNASLDTDYNDYTKLMFSSAKSFGPKYIAEVIKFVPIEGNEDLPQRLEEVLYNVGDYVGIPYWSEQHQTFFDLYSAAEIVGETATEDGSILDVDLIMSPFDLVKEKITIKKSENAMLYIATNKNKLRYHDRFDAIAPEKMQISIALFQNEDNWVLYGLGGANVPKVPFFTERIQTSFINRIKTFCTFIFEKF